LTVAWQGILREICHCTVTGGWGGAYGGVSASPQKKIEVKMVHSGSCKVNPDILDTESLGELNDTIDQT